MADVATGAPAVLQLETDHSALPFTFALSGDEALLPSASVTLASVRRPPLSRRRRACTVPAFTTLLASCPHSPFALTDGLPSRAPLPL